ncbi:ATP-dependent helicase [Candidatus Uhrbacteria bacterium]|jgi:DNA helicase II / ATP-dependent DNA helicase PcrA|nr:ATP-dependent helicase [Candidatus Uhrbacteria bacterium]
MRDFVLSPQSSSKLEIDYENDLNDQQLDVVKNGEGRTLVLAGAGSGKTRTITYRVAWMLEHGVAPENILLLTFTNKAAKEMISRLSGLLGPRAQGVWAGTFHSVANRLLRRYADKLGYDSRFSILDQDDARELVRLCIKDLKIDTKNRRFPSPSVVRGIISYQQNKQDSIADVLEDRYNKFSPLRGEIDSVADLYRTLKMTQNVMDFDDLLLNFRKLLSQDEEVGKQLSSMFQYVLVDEFQDTNKVQSQIVDLISQTHKNLLVVGDDAQSIYSFRAAEIENILAFPKRYPGAKTFRLTKNYRSTPEILEVANQVIARNTNQFKKELEAVGRSGARPSLVPAANTGQEAQFIADQVLQLRDQGVELREMAVLFRASFHSQALEFELMKRDIPYEYRGGLKFFERAHIKDAVAHLRLMNNVRDIMAWMRALRLHPGIGLVTAQKIATSASACQNIEDVLMLPLKTGKRAAAGWQGFLRVLREMLEAGGTPSEFIRGFAGSEDYQDYLENEYPNASERKEDLEQFATFAEQTDDIGEFLDYVSLTAEYGAERGGKEKVNEERMVLSTVHQSKGLEWDAVFVMHLNEGSFPHGRAFSEKGGVQEERRLFYVAATRARKHLFLTYPLTAGYDTLEMKQPSTFLGEISSHATEEVRLQRSGYRRQPMRRPTSSFSAYDDGPTIVLDKDGERVSKPSPSSFLRGVDEL